MPQGVNAIALAENLHSTISLFWYHGGSWTTGIHKFPKHTNQLLPRKPYIYAIFLEMSRFKYIQIRLGHAVANNTVSDG